MKGQIGNAQVDAEPAGSVKIVNTKEFLKKMSSVITRRAYDIYRSRGRSTSDRENWLLAEKEVLQPLCCGILESSDRVTISTFCCDLGPDRIDRVEICIEPHRLIVAEKRKKDGVLAEAKGVYQVLSLAEEFNPSSAKIHWHNSVLEIEISKEKSRMGRIGISTVA